MTSIRTSLAVTLGLCMAQMPQMAGAGTLIAEAFRSVQAPSVEGLALQYHLSPFYERGETSASWGFRIATDDAQNSFVGGGVTGQHSFGNGWFVQAGVMPGYYSATDAEYELGSDLEFYSFAAIGHSLGEKAAVSFSAAHMSNANLGTINPGRNFLALRLSTSF